MGVCKMMEVLEFYSIMHRTSVAPTLTTHLNWVDKAKDGTRTGSGDEDVQTTHHGATSLKRCRSHKVFHDSNIHICEVQLLLFLYLFMVYHKGNNDVLSHLMREKVCSVKSGMCPNVLWSYVPVSSVVATGQCVAHGLERSVAAVQWLAWQCVPIIMPPHAAPPQPPEESF